MALLGLIPQRIAEVQLAYRTIDMHGGPMVAVTTVLVPSQRVPGETCPIMSYECAIETIAGQCLAKLVNPSPYREWFAWRRFRRE